MPLVKLGPKNPLILLRMMVDGLYRDLASNSPCHPIDIANLQEVLEEYGRDALRNKHGDGDSGQTCHWPRPKATFDLGSRRIDLNPLYRKIDAAFEQTRLQLGSWLSRQGFVAIFLPLLKSVSATNMAGRPRETLSRFLAILHDELRAQQDHK
jgi:hypothetical protein